MKRAAIILASAFYRVRISDHKIELITTFKDVRRASWILGSWAGLSPDDSPLLLRDVSTHEIYALDLRLPYFYAPAAWAFETATFTAASLYLSDRCQGNLLTH